MIFRSPLPKLHYYHNKRLQARNPKYLTNLQLNPYPNTQLDLFCSDSSPFWCTAAKYVTNVARIPVRDFKTPIWKDCWLQSSSVHPHDENQEDAWSQNLTVQIHSNFFKRKRWIRSRTLSPVTICLKEFSQCLCNLCTILRLLKQSFYMCRVRRKEGPKTDSRIPRKTELDYKILKPRQIEGVEKLSTSCRALMNLHSFLISWTDLKASTLDLETWFLEVFKHILSLPKYK